MPESPIEKEMFVTVRKWISNGVKHWLKDNAQSETQVREKVFKILDDRRNEVIAKLLGFDDSWGRWEVKLTNAMDKDSPIGQLVRSQLPKAVESWVKRSLTEFELNVEQKRAMRAYFQDMYTRALRDKLNAMAAQKAEQAVDFIYADETDKVMKGEQ